MQARLTIVSGGQTGVDRAALDAALSLGCPCGGWCPAGRLAEDGSIPAHYPVTELAGADYLARTRQNVIDSDGTLVVTYGRPSGGTARTIEFCQQLNKPLLVVAAAGTSPERAAQDARRFVSDHNFQRLNVAGPRASKAAGAYEFAFALICGLLRSNPAPTDSDSRRSPA
jgi:Circularly permutated YpsA SLOG family